MLEEPVELDIGENLLGIGKMWRTCGETKSVEYPQYQQSPSSLCIAWTEVGSDIPAGEPRAFLTVVESSLESLMEEVVDVTSHSLADLLKSHTEGWNSLWEDGVVIVEGEDEHLERSVLAAQYYLFLSLPFPELASRPLSEYCGLSPGGLANGLLGQDYQGHSFWDTESWMFPALLLLQPRTARALLDYRLNRSQERYQRFSTTKKQFFTDLTKLETMPPPQDGQEPGSRGRVLSLVERFSFRFLKDLLFVEKDVYLFS